MNGVGELSIEATRLIAAADEVGIVLRALGSVGVRLHCPTSLDEMVSRDRKPKDVDLITRKRDRRDLRRFFESEGYQTDRDMLVAMEGTRYLFRNRERNIDVDVWVDVLDLCHTLDVSRRLDSGPSLTIEDLLLSKLQIVDLTPGDIEDMACILTTHDLGDDETDPEVIDFGYISSVLGDDWGFWRTATGNLTKLSGHLNAGDRFRVTDLLRRLQTSPKTLRWKVRARIGERVQWWQDVDIPRDTY